LEITTVAMLFLTYIVLRYTGNRRCIAASYIGRMKKLTLSDYQALAEFRYQIRRFLHFSEQEVKQAGLERGQYQLMLAIIRSAAEYPRTGESHANPPP
jgi:hypothetical protein